MMIQNQKSEVFIRKLVKSLVLGLIILLLLGQPSTVQAQLDSDKDGIPDTKETELASRYLPSLQFKAGERFFPVDMTYHLNNSVLKWRSGETVTTVDLSPSISTISTLGENYFLDNRLGNLTEIAADYGQRKASLGYTVYARVTKEFQFTVVQYWFFYAYNDAALNEHEGDWEMIEILLDDAENPISAVYSQHLQGQRALWSDVEKVETTHPKVYVARGSHANYFRPYQGRLGLESDEVGDDGAAVAPSNLKMILLGEIGSGNHPPSQDWLGFGGRWGNWAKLADANVGFAGPYGPGHGENGLKWYSPTSWGETVSLVDGTWFTLSWVASNFLPMFMGVTAILGLWKVWKIVRVKRAGGLRLHAISKAWASVGVALGVVGILLTVAGMLLPWYTVRANVQTTLLSTQGETDLLILDGQRGILVNLLVGGRGPSPLLSFQIPMGVLLLVGAVFRLIDIAGVDEVKSLGNKYIGSGITFIILFTLLLLFILQLTSIVHSLAGMLGVTLPPGATEMARAIAQQPLQGAQTRTIGDFGVVYLSWGLGLGAYMLLAASIAKLIGGAILRGAPEPKP
ncbi:MAG: Vps62-related protein [Candidatus Bathyarchaeia archaeon]